MVHNGTEPGKNIATLDFYYKQFGYLLGVIAGKMSKSGKIGFIGAQKIKFSTDLVESYEVGFKSVQPGGEVYIAWTNDWDDIAKGKEAALSQIAQGADVIFPTMDNAAVGSLQAAKEKDVWGFYLYYDSIVDWPDTVLQSAIMDIKAAMVDLIALAMNGKAEGKNILGEPVAHEAEDVAWNLRGKPQLEEEHKTKGGVPRSPIRIGERGAGGEGSDHLPA